MIKRINAMYFSGTSTTEKVICGLTDKFSNYFYGEISVNNINFTLPAVREVPISFTKEDIVIIGTPVYAGRVPNILLKYLNSIKGNGALAVVVVVYGNRNYDDALIELKDILQENDFKVIAGGAFIGEHSFSKTLAKDRPDEKDMAIVDNFANKIYEKITTEGEMKTIIVNGNTPYRKYYMPKDKNNMPVDIRKVTPKTNDNCNHCNLCVDLCPMGSIDSVNPSSLNGICIKCGACIKNCPNGAKYYDDNDYLRHKEELEIEYASRKNPEIFL